MEDKKSLLTLQSIQFLISFSSVVSMSILCFILQDWLGYKVTALLLLVTVSILATFLDILPLLSAAVLSALIWNFFFIPPVFTFHIGSAEDTLMFLMYFFISLINAMLTSRIRNQEKKARDKEEKEKTIALYNTILTSLSHELRTPIATVIGAVDTLKENREQLSPENKSALLDEIEIAADRLNRQVENLLHVSRLESGTIRLHLDWCDINELIWSIINKFDHQITHTIKFSPGEIQPLYKLDAGLIEQVIHNLIHNAIQYTPDHSLILIDTAYADENLIITISDNGQGISKENMKHIFEKFYRPPNSKPGGIGLGLNIVKGIIEAHKGNIELSGNGVMGLTCVIHLPAETTFINYLKNE